MPENSNPLSGVLLIDKPAGPTSHDVVHEVRQLLRQPNTESGKKPRPPKVGHAGTLDPFATGLLLLGIGSATRLLEYAHDWDKEYEAVITLGATSDTDDATGTISTTPVDQPPSLKDVTDALPQFTGTIAQHPPSYAAIKLKGKKLYEYARAGQHVEVPARQVTIHEIIVLDYSYPTLSIRVRCESGTYIRALARDIGAALGTGGHCSALRRTRHGVNWVSTAQQLADVTNETVQRLLPPSLLTAEMTTLTLSDEQILAFRHGQEITLADNHSTTTHIALLDGAGELIGTGLINSNTHTLLPSKVLA